MPSKASGQLLTPPVHLRSQSRLLPGSADETSRVAHDALLRVHVGHVSSLLSAHTLANRLASTFP